MSELTGSDLEILKMLRYGAEVRVKDSIDGEVKIHWFENMGKDGFYTTEHQGKSTRFISIGIYEKFLDFETIKDFLTCRKDD